MARQALAEIFTLGVAYYPDYLHEQQEAQASDGTVRPMSIKELIACDLERMKGLGIRVIRMGEFSWSLLEPEPGVFQPDRFLLALDLAASLGIQVVFCTPTATPPKWLCDRHPEILPRNRLNQTVPFGGRRHYDPASRVYQRESRRITELYVAAFGQHPAVIGWQTDNEWGHHGSWQSFTADCEQQFRAWLRPRYQDSIERLNQEWFTGFWSQRYRSFDEIDLPRATWNPPNPHLEMEFRRFMTEVYVRLQRDQLQIIRAGSPGRWVTHNLIPQMFDLCLWQLTRDLDIVGYDHYQLGPWPDPARSASQFNLMRSLKQGRPFLVLEQQPVQVNWQKVNRRFPLDWLFLWGAQAAWLGAKGMYYFSWRRFAGGTEQFHDAVLTHDLRVRESMQEKVIQAKAAFFQLLGESFGLDQLPEPTAEVLIIHSVESLWAHENPQQSEAWQAATQVDKIHQAFLALGVGVDYAESLEAAAERLSNYRVLVFPGYAFALSEAERARLRRFVEQGGQVLSLPRSGFKDRLSKMVPFPLQLFDRDDFHFADFGALDEAERERVRFVKPGMKALEGELWSEKLQLPAESPWKVLARFADGLYKKSPALIRRDDFGQGGAALHLAFWPVLSEALLDFLQQQLQLKGPTRLPLSGHVQGYPLQLRDQKYYGLINFSQSQQTIAWDGRAAALQSGLIAWIKDDGSLATEKLQPLRAGYRRSLKLPARAVFLGACKTL